MREWLVSITKLTVLVIDTMALTIIIVGTAQALVCGRRLLLTGDRNGSERREVWLRYARVLVEGLTFQLASDIIESSIILGWESVARLGAIAVIRTFLNYFLNRDLAEIRDRQHQASDSLVTKAKGILE